jgi:hypothetical protein
MSKVLNVFKLIALVLLCVILAPIAYESWHQRAAFESDVRRLSALIGRAEQTMDNFKEATDTWKTASEKQSESTTFALSSTKETLASLNSLVKRTDVSLNESVLPNLAAAVNLGSQDLSKSQADLQANLKQMLATTQQAQKTLVDVDRQVSNPSVQASIDNLATAMKNASKATQHLAGITKAGEETAQYYEKRLTTPQSFFKTLLQAVLQLGSQARILFDK